MRILQPFSTLQPREIHTLLYTPEKGTPFERSLPAGKEPSPPPPPPKKKNVRLVVSKERQGVETGK